MTEKKSLLLIAALAAAAICIILFGSCRSVQYVPVEKVCVEKVTEHDSIYVERVVHDSVATEAKGDTILIHHWHTEYKDRWRDRWKDSIKVDSIPVPYPVERKLSKWEQTKIDWGGEAIIAIIVVFFIIIWLIVKRLQR